MVFLNVVIRDFMFSEFRMGPAASGRGLRGIDRVLFKVTKSRVKKWEVLARRKYTYYNSNRKTEVISIFSSCKEFPFFDT